jgi:hypothetical protein
MDRDTLQDDLDLMLEPSRGDELPGEWDWEPPLGTGAPVASLAAEARETEEMGTEASSEGASDPPDGPGDETQDEAEDDAEEEEDD